MKRLKRKKTNQILQWIAAFIIAAIIMNVLLGFYNTTAGWIDRTKAATLSIYRPNSGFLFGTEGRGYHKTDSRGYLNNIDKLANNYIIAVGSSFTQGKEVKSGERFTDLLNRWYGYQDKAYVYNVSQVAYYLPDLLQGFQALISEFPDSKTIIIETARTNCDIKKLKKAYKQREYDEKQTGGKIMSTLSTPKKISMLVKEYSPLVLNCYNKYRTITKPDDGQQSNDKNIPIDEYKEALDRVYSKIKSLYEGRIIIVYQPHYTIERDGKMIMDREETYNAFVDECKKHSIEFLDMGDRFEKEYKTHHVLPRGFSNSSFVEGHLNRDGNKMVAEELYKVLKRGE